MDAAPLMARSLGPMPVGKRMVTVDEQLVGAPVHVIFDLARDVEQWPARLPHYRWVRFRERTADGGGVVEMAAWRPFGRLRWPTWWLSDMAVDEARPAVRFRHIGGITRGMDVEWSFEPGVGGAGTAVRIVHVWDGPRWPVIGGPAATILIGPVFIHGIASRTLAGLAVAAERTAGSYPPGGPNQSRERSSDRAASSCDHRNRSNHADRNGP